MARAGEESGRIPESLEHAAKSAQTEARERLRLMQKVFSGLIYAGALVYVVLIILSTLPVLGL